MFNWITVYFPSTETDATISKIFTLAVRIRWYFCRLGVTETRSKMPCKTYPLEMRTGESGGGPREKFLSFWAVTHRINTGAQRQSAYAYIILLYAIVYRWWSSTSQFSRVCLNKTCWFKSLRHFFVYFYWPVNSSFGFPQETRHNDWHKECAMNRTFSIIGLGYQIDYRILSLSLSLTHSKSIPIFIFDFRSKVVSDFFSNFCISQLHYTHIRPGSTIPWRLLARNIA